MTETIVLSVLSFAGTNIDDLFVNMLLYAGAQTKGEARRVTAGKYLGIGMLTALSILGAYGVRLLPGGIVSLLGVVPIALGVRELAALRKGEPDSGESGPVRGTVLRAALVTIAGGADNIGVYIPLFAGFAGWQQATAVCVFAAMTGVWCLLSRKLTELQQVRRMLESHRRVLAPAAYIVLGVYVLLKGII